MTKTTSELARASRGPVDPAACAAANIQVSLASRWNDAQWRIDFGTPGTTPEKIDFAEVPTAMVASAKVAVWSALADPRGKWTPKPATVYIKSYALDRVLSWVARRGVMLADLTPKLFDDFVSDIDEAIEDGAFRSSKNPDSVSQSELIKLLGPWQLLARQAPSMRESKVDALEFDPFSAMPLERVVAALGGTRAAPPPPLPDEITLRLIPAAERLLGQAADEVIEMQEQYVRVSHGRNHRNHKSPPIWPLLPKVEFSILDGDEKPWFQQAHDPRMPRSVYGAIAGASAQVLGAALHVVYAFGSLRAGEFASLGGGRSEDGTLPACVTHESSSSGHLRLYKVHGHRFKLLAHGRPDSWVIGAVGADAPMSEVPLAVRALDVIERLMAPLARQWVGPNVPLMMRYPAGVPSARNRGAVAMTTDGMRGAMAAFARSAMDWADLPDLASDGTDLRAFKATKGSNIGANHWRKTIVQFMMRLDARMSLPLSRHLKHLSSLITEDRYLTSSPQLMEEVDGAMAGLLATTLVQIARGSDEHQGWLVDLARKHMDDIGSEIAGLDDGAAAARLKPLLHDRQLGLMLADPGHCGLRLSPVDAMCHIVARTRGWYNDRPNPSRTDEACAVCKCCISGQRHIPFWTRRYVGRRRQVLRAREIGREAEFWVHEGEAAVAEMKLLALGAPIPTDEQILGVVENG